MASPVDVNWRVKSRIVRMLSCGLLHDDDRVDSGTATRLGQVRDMYIRRRVHKTYTKLIGCWLRYTFQTLGQAYICP